MSSAVLSDVGHASGEELFLSYGHGFWQLQQNYTERVQDAEDDYNKVTIQTDL